MTRKPYPRFTTAIEFQRAAGVTPGTMDSGGCEFRQYVGKVLRAVDAYGPRAVVLDIVLQASIKCERETRVLQDAAHAACKSYPVILAYSVDPESWMRMPGPGIGNEDFCEEGPDNADDLRKVPLGISVKNVLDGKASSLALTAAARVDSAVLRRPPLKEALSKGGELFASMIAHEDWPLGQSRIPAEAIVAPNGVAATPDPKLIPWLRGRVLVFGSDEEQNFKTVAGKMHGFLIQANYIEAILDGRLFWQISKWWQLAIGFLFWLSLELVNHGLDRMWETNHPRIGWLWRSVALLAMLLLLASANGALVTFFGGYGDFATVSIIGVFGFVAIELFRGSIEDKKDKPEGETK